MQQWATLVLHPNPMKHMSKATLRKKGHFVRFGAPKLHVTLKKQAR